MGDLLQRGMSMIARTFKEHASGTVTYRRGPHRLTIAATIGDDAAEVEAKGGGQFRTNIEWRQFFVTAADLILNGLAFEPQQGDEICETHGSETIVYELQPTEEEPAWRYADAYRQTVILNCRRVRKE